MLRQEGLAFLKAISSARPSPALVKELRKAKTNAKKKKRPTVLAGRRKTTKVAEKRKANELASSGDTSEPAKRRPTTGDGYAPLPVSSTSATGEQAATGGRQLGSSEGGATYAAVVTTPIVAAPVYIRARSLRLETGRFFVEDMKENIRTEIGRTETAKLHRVYDYAAACTKVH